MQKLAIIPFENLNEDEGDGLLVDGIVEDLITEFSMIKSSRSSRKACFDMRQSGLTHDQLKAVWSLDFVVSGSIRSIQDRIRISMQSYQNLRLEKVVWSSKFDHFKTDIFEIQDEIVRKIVLAILGEIEISSLHRADRKPTANMTSYSAY